MIVRGMRVAGGVLIALLCAWAGIQMYAIRMPATKADVGVSAGAGAPAGVLVPAGVASAPNDSDMASDFEPKLSVGAKIPDRLPDFSLTDREGKLTPISAWRGKSLVLNFWATWCAPCRHEIPLLKAISHEWSAHDVAVIGVAVDYRDKVLAYADELHIPYPLLIGEEDALNAAAALGVDSPAFPFTVFTDRRGQVVALYTGELHKPQADLILGVVQTLNQDRVQLPEARRAIADGLHALAAVPSAPEAHAMPAASGTAPAPALPGARPGHTAG